MMARVKTKSLLSASKPTGNRPKTSTRSLRFELTLKETTKEEYSEFNYLDLIEEEKEKHVQQKAKANGHHDPEDPFGDDSEGLREIARRFEQKYGTGSSENRRKRRDASELGAGYDENDPFIDNSDVYDEELPSNKRPSRRGFYINAGLLQLQLIESAERERPPPAKRKRAQRLSSEEDGTTGDDQEPVAPTSRQQEEPPPRKRLGRPPKKDAGGNLLRKKKRLAIDGLLKKKSGITVKEMLQQKKALQRQQGGRGGGEASPLPPPPPPPPAPPAQTRSPAAATPEEPPLTNGQVNGHAESPDSIDESIANVVAAAARDASSPQKTTPPAPAPARQPSSSSAANSSGGGDSSDSDSSDSSSDGDSSSAAEDAADEEDTPPERERRRRPSEDGLPTMSAELAALVVAIKEAALVSNRTGEGKQKFFSPDVNKMLLNIELHSQRELMRNDRQALYLHLASRLPCGAQTLNKRAKQLLLDEEKHVIRKPLARLKEAIEAAMPAIQEQYAEECKKVMEAKGLPMPDSKKSDAATSEPEKKPSLPRKRFRWNTATRDRLRRVVEVRAYSFKMLKKRQGAAEEFLSSFLDTDVLPLWQKGWMSARELMKHCLPVFQEEIKKKIRAPAKPETPPRRGRPPNDPNKHLNSQTSKHHSSPRPAPSASPRVRAASPERTSLGSAAAAPPAPPPAPPPAAAASAPAPAPAAADPGEKKPQHLHRASPPEKVPDKRPQHPPRPSPPEKAPDKSLQHPPSRTEQMAEKTTEKAAEKQHEKAERPPAPTEQLWQSFTPEMSVEAMAEKLKRHMRELSAHVAFKLREAGGQPSAEVLRYQDELRRLEVAFQEVEKGQAKQEKKKKLAKQVDPVTGKPTSSGGSSKWRRPEEKKPRPPRPSLTAQLKPARPDTPASGSGSPASTESARQTPPVRVEPDRPAAAAAAAPSSAASTPAKPTPNGLTVDPPTVSVTGSGTARRGEADDGAAAPPVIPAEAMTPSLPVAAPPVTATFQRELEKLRQGMSSSAQRISEPAQAADLTARRGSGTSLTGAGRVLPPPEVLRESQPATTSPPVAGPPLSPERRAVRPPSKPTPPQPENKHPSPKKIHLYGRSQTQASLDGAGDTLPEVEAAEAAEVAAVAEARKKEEAHKRLREINEAEVNDAVASIMGGCGDPVADLSLCASPEPQLRSGPESHPVLSLRGPSGESFGEARRTSVDSDGRRRSGDLRRTSLDSVGGGAGDGGSRLAGNAADGGNAVSAAAALSESRKDSMEDLLGGLTSAREPPGGQRPSMEARPELRHAVESMAEPHLPAAVEGWPEGRQLSADSTADFFQPDAEGPRRAAATAADGAASRRRRSRSGPGAGEAAARPAHLGLDLSAATAGKRPSVEDDTPAARVVAPPQSQPAAGDVELGELDWVMQELMSFNNQRKDASPSVDSRAAPPSPAASAPAPAAPPARNSILQMAAHQADIFSPDPTPPPPPPPQPQLPTAAYTPFSTSRSPFSADYHHQHQLQQQQSQQSQPPSPAARVIHGSQAAARAGGVLPGPRQEPQPADLAPGYRSVQQSPALARALSGGVSPALRDGNAEGLMGHFSAASAPGRLAEPSRQQTSPQTLPQSPQSPLMRQHQRYSADARTSPAAARGFAQHGRQEQQHRLDPAHMGTRQDSRGQLRQDYQSGHSPARQDSGSMNSPARPDPYPIHSPARQDQHQIPSPVRQDSQLMLGASRQDSHSMSSPASSIPSPARSDQRQMPSPGRPDPYSLHSPASQEPHPLHGSLRPDSLPLSVASRQDRHQRHDLSPAASRHDRLFNSAPSPQDPQMVTSRAGAIGGSRLDFTMSGPASRLESQSPNMPSRHSPMSSLSGRQESAMANPNSRLDLLSGVAAPLRQQYSSVAGMTSSAGLETSSSRHSPAVSSHDVHSGGVLSRPDRGNFMAQLQVERDLLPSAQDMAAPRQTAAHRRHGVTSPGDRGATVLQRPPGYYTGEEPRRSGAAADVTSRSVPAGGGRDYSAIYNSSYHQTARQQPQFRPPAPVTELSAYQMRQPSGSYHSQFPDTLTDFSQDSAQRRQHQQQQQRQQQQQHQQQFPF